MQVYHIIERYTTHVNMHMCICTVHMYVCIYIYIYLCIQSTAPFPDSLRGCVAAPHPVPPYPTLPYPTLPYPMQTECTVPGLPDNSCCCGGMPGQGPRQDRSAWQSSRSRNGSGTCRRLALAANGLRLKVHLGFIPLYDRLR